MFLILASKWEEFSLLARDLWIEILDNNGFIVVAKIPLNIIALKSRNNGVKKFLSGTRNLVVMLA